MAKKNKRDTLVFKGVCGKKVVLVVENNQLKVVGSSWGIYTHMGELLMGNGKASRAKLMGLWSGDPRVLEPTWRRII